MPTSAPRTEAYTDPVPRPEPPPRPPLAPAARRALAEAEARRSVVRPPEVPEIEGRGGLEPVRYGDWEVKGLASDF